VLALYDPSPEEDLAEHAAYDIGLVAADEVPARLGGIPGGVDAAGAVEVRC